MTHTLANNVGVAFSRKIRSYPKSESNLATIKEKVMNGERLTREDGVLLYETANLLELGNLANYVREKRHGNNTYFNQNFHMNATNVCEADCLFCSFARIEPDSEKAFTLNLQQAKKFIEEHNHAQMTEIHIVNGLHKGLPFEYYTDLLQMVRDNFPHLHIKAFTAVEIKYFAQKYDISICETLEKLMDAGLMSMPGGGAEIFAKRVRDKVCRNKVSAEDWLDIHRQAHRLGLRSNATMLYGHIENYSERIDHLISLRRLQDETGGFQTFIPLAFHPEGNRMRHLQAPTGFDDLRTYAISRLMLDNFDHIKSYWVMVGPKIAQISLSFGVDDLDGTVVSEKIYKMSGSQSPNMLTKEQLEHLICEAGRTPVERDTLYNVVGEDHDL